MIVTVDNYFDADVAAEYMSTSQFKAFLKCQAHALADIKREVDVPQKDAFVEGHMFEALTCGDAELFYMQHPEIISSQGKTKGNVKCNYQKVVAAADAFNRQEVFRRIVDRCDKQVLVTGTIAGAKFRGLLDLYDPTTGEIYDTKAMCDFAPQYLAIEGRRAPWWEYWGYHYQAAIYTELVRQTFDREPTFALIAATKENVPDVAWIQFDAHYLRNVLDIIEEHVPTYAAIKGGLIDPEPCGICDYCKTHKIISAPEVVEMGGC